MPEDVPPSPAEHEHQQEHPTPPEQGHARLILHPQETPFTHPDSHCHFAVTAERPLTVTAGAAAKFDTPTILACLYRLQYLARLHDGLDYLQVFSNPATQEEVWFIENEAEGVITVLLPEEY